MGRLNHDQGESFYFFSLDEAVPDDHPVRAIAAVLDFSWVHSELASLYPKTGRRSIEPVPMVQMLKSPTFAPKSECLLSVRASGPAYDASAISWSGLATR